MTSPIPESALSLDQRCLWHPFTQMKAWIAGEPAPLTIVRGDGVYLEDAEGNRYIDGNASIWTNLHGHRRPEIDAAITAQLGRIAHSSFLGLTNDAAPPFADDLLRFMFADPSGRRVFFSDDGSTAIETGLKMIHQARLQRGESERKVFVSLGAGYHGDTVGAMSLGHSGVFHNTYRSLLFETREVMSPACYRCPFNRAAPERGVDARNSRRCNWECAGILESALNELGPRCTAFVLEPRVQGAGFMSMHPHGYLKRAAEICKEHGAWLFLDEVLTGFGRTGEAFAFQHEDVLPDVVALGKGITGGYLPFAATVTSGEIFEAFLGEYEEFKTFFHGHSYSGNQLGAAAAHASLRLLRTEHSLNHIQGRAQALFEAAQRLWSHSSVGDVRCEGMICAVELVADFHRRTPFPAASRIGWKVCEAAKSRGLLTRPIGDVLVLMPPYCITDSEIGKAVDALAQAIDQVILKES